MTSAVVYAFNHLAHEGSGDASESRGYEISDEERGYMEAGDRQAFWKSRIKAGDPMAPVALGIVDMTDGNMLSLLNHGLDGALGMGANEWLQFRAAVAGVNVDLDAVGNELMRAHVEAVDTNDGQFLDARDITDYHHEVFAEFDIPRAAFGGTPVTGHAWEDRFTRRIWYRRESE